MSTVKHFKIALTLGLQLKILIFNELGSLVKDFDLH